MNIDAPDGGEDGHLEWRDGPDPAVSDYLPSRINAFQVKATGMTPDRCGREVLNKRMTDLKPRIRRSIERGGAYLLFYGRCCNPRQIQLRIEQIRQAIGQYLPDAAATANIQVYGAERIAEWANLYLAAQRHVLSEPGKNMPLGVQTWEEWRQEQNPSLQLILDESRGSIIRELSNLLAEPRTMARLTGLSGLGKTRLA